jgi:predicted nucleic acid-binding protein
MGIILDCSILIAGERRRDSVSEVLQRVEAKCGKTAAALSAVTSVELTHGIYRAKTDADRKHRESFVEELFRAVSVHALTLEVARLWGASTASRWARESVSTSLT